MYNIHISTNEGLEDFIFIDRVANIAEARLIKDRILLTVIMLDVKEDVHVYIENEDGDTVY